MVTGGREIAKQISLKAYQSNLRKEVNHENTEVRMKDSNKVFGVTRGQHIVRGCLAKIEF